MLGRKATFNVMIRNGAISEFEILSYSMNIEVVCREVIGSPQDDV